MVSTPPLLRRRFLCTTVSKNWTVKQVTKSNFQESLEDIKNHISSSDFIAVSLQKTGSYSAPLHRVLSIDTPEIAYWKAKYAAERFQVLQFAVCPFSIRASNYVIAHPYNFHLFPRDELKIGMPSYSFSCQTSYLTATAREGFDFNSCIYDGISYLSRMQESAAKTQMGNPIPSPDVIKSSSVPTLADTLFVQRIRSRIKHWKNTCKSSSLKTDEPLLWSIRKIVLGNEEYRSRPCMTIDVCSERQVQLVLEMLEDFSDDLVPLIIPAKGGSIQAVRVVWTSSKEEKELFERELQNVEEEENKKIRGFREVIELISASQKPVVSHNSLNDFTFIHSKFIAPLPPKVDEFMCSLRMVFPYVLELNILMKKIGPLRKTTNISAAISYLKNHFLAPIDIEIPHKVNEGKVHGHNALKICLLFAKLCSILKISPSVIESGNEDLAPTLKGLANIFSRFSTNLEEPVDGNISFWSSSTRKVMSEHLVFLWGFKGGITAGMLKGLLRESHDIFSREFDVKLVDKSTAIVVFWQPGLSQTFVDIINSDGISGSLRELVSDGLKGTCYETYKRVCRLGLWELNLAGSLDRALMKTDCYLEDDSKRIQSEMYWYNDDVINLEEL
ncbi:Poly(A)-specific ribonuclease PARN-like [Quillaja saponaria]|uniref:Poly(A)-specific ribonuclease PARN-like n=1 Tax=Quillaja saponaria TaxID=32244 RepID=A0AAD7LRJ7_QUISA|nr:Poly(A)-specific ribonuclease PARN-like [Quillaja saponaria]